MTFLDGTNVLGTVAISVVNGSVQATLANGTLSAGSHAITAVYSGDSNFTTSTSTAITQTVCQAATTSSVASTITATTFGESTTFTATIASVSPGAGTPTGSVTFYDGTNALGVGTPSVVNGVDQATLCIGSLSAGSHSITAVYGGDSNFTTSTSTAITQTVGQAATTTSVASSLNPANDGQSITFTATVGAVSPGCSGAHRQCHVLRRQQRPGHWNSQCRGRTGSSHVHDERALAIGSHSITAVYGGDSNFTTSSTSTALSQAIGLAASSASVATSASPAVFGQSITFTATVGSVISAVGVPTGNVSFYDGSTLLGSGALGVVNGVNQASFSATSSLSVGSHSITAVYGGDSTFAGSTSTVLMQAISQAGTTTSVTSSVVPMTFGQSTTFTATIGVVSPGAGVPSGIVTFLDGTTVLGTGSLSVVNGAVQAAYSTSSLSAGSHSITAVYAGDGCFATSTSAAITQTVGQAATTIGVVSTIAATTFGQSTTLTATIAAVSPARARPPAASHSTMAKLLGSRNACRGERRRSGYPGHQQFVGRQPLDHGCVRRRLELYDQHVGCDRANGRPGQHHDQRRVERQSGRVWPIDHV